MRCRHRHHRRFTELIRSCCRRVQRRAPQVLIARDGGWSHPSGSRAAAAARAQAARVQDSGRQRVPLNLESCVHLGAETQQQHWRSSGARRAKTCELVSLYMRQNYLILLNNINNNNKNEWINEYLSRKPPNVLFLQPHSWRQYNIWDTLHLKNGDGEMTPIENT